MRALSLLALQDENSSRHCKEIASELGLPPQFLSKVLQRLGAAGLVSSRRGRTGGFRIARPAEKIALLEVVEIFEGNLGKMECVFGLASCSEGNACALHCEWNDIKKRLRNLLNNTTLADVASQAILTTSSFAAHSNRDSKNLENLEK